MLSCRLVSCALPSLVATLALAASACASPPVLPAPTTAKSAEHACPEGRKWDEVAKECRLYPGGGYGWAGCSLRESSGPPTGGRCITGTRWDHCDCVPDAPPPAGTP